MEVEVRSKARSPGVSVDIVKSYCTGQWQRFQGLGLVLYAGDGSRDDKGHGAMS